MVFGTRRTSGVKAFKRGKWVVDGDEGMRFSDPRTTAARKAAETVGQPSLFEAFEDPESGGHGPRSPSALVPCWQP